MDRPRGTWKMNVVNDSVTEPLDFDAENGDDGWNALGTFEIAAGEVRLEISRETEGKYVLADAIRWTPVGADPGAVASR